MAISAGTAFALSALLSLGSEYYYGSEEEKKQKKREKEARAAMQRQYEANLSDYNVRTEAINKQIEYYKGIAESPGTMHPSFAKFKRSVEQQATSTRQGITDVLRRRGITGGAQQKATEDIQEQTEKTLATTLADISAQATAKSFQLEGARPTRPHLGGIYSPTTLPTQRAPTIGADLSGFGALAAYYGRGDTTAPTEFAGGGGGGIADFTFGIDPSQDPYAEFTDF